jgi:hypothetical protein
MPPSPARRRRQGKVPFFPAAPFPLLFPSSAGIGAPAARRSGRQHHPRDPTALPGAPTARLSQHPSRDARAHKAECHQKSCHAQPRAQDPTEEVDRGRTAPAATQADPASSVRHSSNGASRQPFLLSITP